jgi:hypothetical protein
LRPCYLAQTRTEPVTRVQASRAQTSYAVLWQKAARSQTGAARCHGATLFFGAVLGGALLASGCGGSSPAASVAHLATTTTSRSAKGSSNANAKGSSGGNAKGSSGGNAKGSSGGNAKGSSGGNAKGSSGGNANGSPLAYAQCMRAHGVPDFPDPNAQGGFSFQGGQEGDLGPDSPAFQQANEDCQQDTPVSGIGHGPSPAQIAQLQTQALKFSECMRSHGLADFPDPVFHTGGGGISISIKGGPGSDLSPNSPAFQDAQQACQKLLPGRKGSSHFSSSGPASGGGAGAPPGNAAQSSGG